MRRMTMLLLLLSLMLVAPLVAHAQGELLCFSATGLVDQIRLGGIETTNPSIPTYAIKSYHHRAAGLYVFRGSTSAGPNEPIPDSIKFAVYAYNESSLFSGNPDCRIAVTIVPPPPQIPPAPLTGSISIQCTGSTGSPFNAGPVPLTQIPCGVSLPIASSSGAAQDKSVFEIRPEHQQAAAEESARTTELLRQGLSAMGEEQNNNLR